MENEDLFVRKLQNIRGHVDPRSACKSYARGRELPSLCLFIFIKWKRLKAIYERNTDMCLLILSFKGPKSEKRVYK